jgi:molybdopterin molybdotransferase
MGDYDIVREVMTQGKNSMDFWKVDIKPGKPLAFGRINGIPAIGLPGNPQSTMVSFYQFARPAILKLMGADQILLPPA